MLILIFLSFLFISSFVLFITSRHDFVLLRQNISIRHIFDKAFIVLFFALIASRAAYLVDEKMYDFFLDPLRFLHVILYYGFNLLGLIAVFSLGIFFFFRKRKNFMRIFDIYMLAFYPLIIFQAIEYILTTQIQISITLSYLIVTLLFLIFLIKIHTGFKIKDGVVSFIVLIFTSISYLGYSFLNNKIAIYSPIQILAILIISISIYLLVLIQINFFKEK